MRIFAFLSLIVVSISCLVQARGPVKITSVDVRVYPHSYFSSLEYSASFRVRLDGRNEVWVCDVGEVTDGSTDWAGCKSNYPTEGVLSLRLVDPMPTVSERFEDPGPLIEKNPFISGPHIDGNPLNPVNYIKKRLERVSLNGDFNMEVSYRLDDTYVSINQADSISAENLQYNGKNEEGQHILASEEVQVLDMQI